ncbi:ABC-2 type transporter [Parafrankia sp. Ea1.12]|uniref:ABC transporter permease n=1 Tax=Parafrankia sp. Ea1.12 TaxID=573499 RepID=UPI000DA448AB|nr:ABC transporter permease [Parafrankia sp. Ea1.12]SQD98227.1 ABC-2 type transporter [Parafrankia sp. Ea1.12]
MTLTTPHPATPAGPAGLPPATGVGVAAVPSEDRSPGRAGGKTGRRKAGRKGRAAAGSGGAAAGAAAEEAPVPLPPPTAFPAAVSAVYRGQLARARVARVPLLFVAAFQSLGIMILLRGIVDVGDDSAAASVVAGSTVLVVAFVALNLLAQRFGALRAAGALDYYLTLPIPGAAVVLGTAASYATFAVPGTVVTVVVGSLLYGLPMGGLWLLIPVTVLAGASLAGIGAAIGLLAPKPELATVAGQLGMSVVLFLGVIPADRLPGIGRLARDLLPSSYAVDALAEGFAPAVDWAHVTVDLAVCAAVAAVTLVVAVRSLRHAGRS